MYRTLPERDGDPVGAPSLPWTTPPGDGGFAACDWCGRAIYAPAVPCSVAPVPGLLSMDTAPGLGDRCKWEVRTRTDGATPPPAGRDLSAG